VAVEGLRVKQPPRASAEKFPGGGVGIGKIYRKIAKNTKKIAI